METSPFSDRGKISKTGFLAGIYQNLKVTGLTNSFLD
jgi:hypothetical protein